MNEHDIEHIMPQSGLNIEAIKETANIKDDDEFKATVNKLGNKILLESKINRKLGNAWFNTKLKLEKKGYKNSKYPIARALAQEYENKKTVWTKDDINSATEKIAERMVKFIFDKS